MSVLVRSLERAPFMWLLGVKDSLQPGAVAPFLGDLLHFISNSNAHPCVLFSFRFWVYHVQWEGESRQRRWPGCGWRRHTRIRETTVSFLKGSHPEGTQTCICPEKWCMSCVQPYLKWHSLVQLPRYLNKEGFPFTPIAILLLMQHYLRPGWSLEETLQGIS